MYLPYQAVHTPLQVPEEYVDLYPEIVNETRRYYAGMFMKTLAWRRYSWVNVMPSICLSFCLIE